MKYPRSSNRAIRVIIITSVFKLTVKIPTYGSEANWSVNVMDREGVVVGCGEVMSSLDV